MLPGTHPCSIGSGYVQDAVFADFQETRMMIATHEGPVAGILPTYFREISMVDVNPSNMFWFFKPKSQWIKVELGCGGQFLANQMLCCADAVLCSIGRCNGL